MPRSGFLFLPISARGFNPVNPFFLQGFRLLLFLAKTC